MTVGLATNRLLLDMQSASVYKEKRNSGAIKINTLQHAWVSNEIGLYLNDRSRKTIEIIKIATLLVITITFHSHVSFIPPFSLNLLYFSIPFQEKQISCQDFPLSQFLPKFHFLPLAKNFPLLSSLISFRSTIAHPPTSVLL